MALVRFRSLVLLAFRPSQLALRPFAESEDPLHLGRIFELMQTI